MLKKLQKRLDTSLTQWKARIVVTVLYMSEIHAWGHLLSEGVLGFSHCQYCGAATCPAYDPNNKWSVSWSSYEYHCDVWSMMGILSVASSSLIRAWLIPEISIIYQSPVRDPSHERWQSGKKKSERLFQSNNPTIPPPSLRTYLRTISSVLFPLSTFFAHQLFPSPVNHSRRTTFTVPLIGTSRPDLEAAATAKRMAIRNGVDGTGTKTLALVVRERVAAAEEISIELLPAGEFGIGNPLVESWWCFCHGQAAQKSGEDESGAHVASWVSWNFCCQG